MPEDVEASSELHDFRCIWLNVIRDGMSDGSFLLGAASSGYKSLNNIDPIYRNPNRLNKNHGTLI
jgi:hypothetical protein